MNCPPRAIGFSSPSGMVFARWRFAMEMRFSFKAATANHSIATFTCEVVVTGRKMLLCVAEC